MFRFSSLASNGPQGPLARGETTRDQGDWKKMKRPGLTVGICHRDHLYINLVAHISHKKWSIECRALPWGCYILMSWLWQSGVIFYLQPLWSYSWYWDLVYMYFSYRFMVHAVHMWRPSQEEVRSWGGIRPPLKKEYHRNIWGKVRYSYCNQAYFSCIF